VKFRHTPPTLEPSAYSPAENALAERAQQLENPHASHDETQESSCPIGCPLHRRATLDPKSGFSDFFTHQRVLAGRCESTAGLDAQRAAPDLDELALNDERCADTAVILRRFTDEVCGRRGDRYA
jgi:hypothetical protein